MCSSYNHKRVTKLKAPNMNMTYNENDHSILHKRHTPVAVKRMNAVT